jgi:2-amino-4-hydroxy-6-hydroxymethyldihydropteridine diphosphokinase
MRRVNRYVVGLGSNLGPCRRTLQSALRSLRALGDVEAASSLYDSAPVGPAQPRYLNAAVLLSSGLPPRAFLSALLEIEREHGRERRERWGPRTLDLDVLWAEGLVYRDEALVVPHPELRDRAFALLPLLEVAPDAEDPTSGESYACRAAALSAEDLHRLTGTELGNWHVEPAPGERPA